MNMKNILKKTALVLAVCLALPSTAEAAGAKTISTGINQEVYAVGQYSNWDGVPSVSQFPDQKGNFCFAYKTGKKIKVVKTKGGKVKSKLNLKMKGSLFGAVTCDSDGNLYAVTGKTNSGDDTTKETVFITKYDAKGNLIKSVGDNGRSSLAYYYDESFNTKEPFAGGTCDVAVNGDYLSVNYGRHMYSGHQSNSVWIIDRNTMETVRPNEDFSNYESHSFGQRAVAYAGGFAFMSEGDCYNRAFTFSIADPAAGTSSETPIFDFWVQKGTLDDYNMYILNDNFAHIGDICALEGGNVSFVASSAKSLSEKAEKQREQLFIQIFDPTKDLTSESAYVTTGKRSGTAGPNGDEFVTNYGVKWLTSYKSGSIDNPQAVTDGKGNTIILYERYDSNYKYLGVYRIVVDKNGKITKKAARVSKTAQLNSCETPIYYNGYVYWCANKYTSDYSAAKKLMVYKLKV